MTASALMTHQMIVGSSLVTGEASALGQLGMREERRGAAPWLLVDRVNSMFVACVDFHNSLPTVLLLDKNG